MTSGWQSDRVSNQVRADECGNKYQRPIKDEPEQNRAENSSDQKRQPVLRGVMGEKRGDQTDRQPTPGNEANETDRKFLQKQRQQSADETEQDGEGELK